MDTIQKDIKTLVDLKNCEWNGKLNSSFIWVQISNLSANGISFMERPTLGFNIHRVDARMSNFTPIGKTFKVTDGQSAKKYDGPKGEMYFLQGLYLDGKKSPSYYLSFLKYTKGQRHPDTCDFKIRKKDILIAK